MANIKSQIKRNKQNEKARLRNKAVRSNLKTRVKSAEAAARDHAEDNDLNEAAVRTALSTIDRAATKGVIHKNAAARKKSRLMKRLAALAAEHD
ncbi:MAG: 30S ribosomal protein S20 [Microthrixaceae bacterium]